MELLSALYLSGLSLTVIFLSFYLQWPHSFPSPYVVLSIPGAMSVSIAVVLSLKSWGLSTNRERGKLHFHTRHLIDIVYYWTQFLATISLILIIALNWTGDISVNWLAVAVLAATVLGSFAGGNAKIAIENMT